MPSDDVVEHLCARRVPDGNAAAGLGHAHATLAGHGIAARHGIGGPMQVDAEEIAGQDVVLDERPRRRLRNEDSGIEIVEIAAGADDFQAAHRAARCIDGNRVSPALPVDDRARRPFQRHTPVEHERTRVPAGRETKRIAFSGAGERRLQVVARTDEGFPGQSRGNRAADTEPDAHGQPHPAAAKRQARCRAKTRHGCHASFGSTSIRPFISICMAWQNHEQ